MQKTSVHLRENSPETILTAAADALTVLRCSNCGLDEYLDRLSGNSLLRRRLSSLLFAYFRHKRWVDAALSACCSKAPKVELQEFMALALTMAAFQDSLVPGSVVNIAVSAAKKRFNVAVGRFVNAVLRKSLAVLTEQRGNPLPPEICRQWEKEFSPDTVQQLAGLFTSQAPNTVRLRSGFAVPENSDMLQPLGLDLPWHFYLCSQCRELLESTDFGAGKYYIQDPAPAHVSKLLQSCLELLPVEIAMLDLCAAPGGKLIMNVEMLQEAGRKLHRVVAFDRSARRLDLVRKNCLRCHVTAETAVGDGSDRTIFNGESFELVTCDVPCSNSGVFRHRPDALWRWNREDLTEITALQQAILNNAARLTADGGLLVYSTCSLETEENSAQIQQFLTAHPEFVLLKEHLFMPQEYCDGTYAAILRKSAERQKYE